MSSLTQEKSHQVVEVLSKVQIPKNILEASNVGSLLTNLDNSMQATERNKQSLENARRELEQGNFLGNWWHDRKDAVQRANENLGSAVVDLTMNSSKLLVFNTAISKVLSDQQSVLNFQQKKLEEQASTLKQQNSKIQQQQNDLYKTHLELKDQQIKINSANQGLLEAKGISQEQAQKLVGIVKQTEKLEDRLEQTFLTGKKELWRALDQFRAEIKQNIEALDEAQDGIRQLVFSNVDEISTHFNSVIQSTSKDLIAKVDNLDSSLNYKVIALEKEFSEKNKSLLKNLDEAIEKLQQDLIAFNTTNENNHQNLRNQFLKEHTDLNNSLNIKWQETDSHLNNLKTHTEQIFDGLFKELEKIDSTTQANYQNLHEQFLTANADLSQELTIKLDATSHNLSNFELHTKEIFETLSKNFDSTVSNNDIRINDRLDKEINELQQNTQSDLSIIKNFLESKLADSKITIDTNRDEMNLRIEKLSADTKNSFQELNTQHSISQNDFSLYRNLQSKKLEELTNNLTLIENEYKKRLSMYGYILIVNFLLLIGLAGFIFQKFINLH